MRAPALPLAVTSPDPAAADISLLRVARPALILIALLAGTALGLGTTDWMLGRQIDIAAIHAGPWTAWPKVGTSEMDPYARAILARTGQIPLAQSEGVLLTASLDDEGRPLIGTCSYSISGATPPAHPWTLSVTTPAGLTADNAAARSGFTSSEVLRRADGSFVVDVGPTARPGNWLPVADDSRFTVALRLYDSQFGVSATGFDRAALPSITRQGCGP